MPSMIEQKIKDLESQGIRQVKIALTDIDGVLRGKYLSLKKFKSVAKSLGGFCDCVLGWDCDDQLYDNASFTGWHTAFPDAQYRIDLSTERRMPSSVVSVADPTAMGAEPEQASRASSVIGPPGRRARAGPG